MKITLNDYYNALYLALKIVSIIYFLSNLPHRIKAWYYKVLNRDYTIEAQHFVLQDFCFMIFFSVIPSLRYGIIDSLYYSISISVVLIFPMNILLWVFSGYPFNREKSSRFVYYLLAFLCIFSLIKIIGEFTVWIYNILL